MKKLMIAILFLIPLIIIMSVNLSGFIISATVKISVESIILKNRGEFISDVYINFNEFNDPNKYYKIDAITYPKLARASLIWTTSDLSVAYVDNGKVYFVGYGEVTISCYSADNVNINARCNFFVSGDTIYSLEIVEYGQETSSNSIELAIYDRKLLDKIIIPANALKDNIINWTSSNTNIVEIDSNGVIYGKNIGTATITISILEEDTYHSDSVIVSVMPAYNLLKNDVIYISSNTVNVADYTTSASFSLTVLEGDATSDNTTLTYTGAGSGVVIAELNHSGIKEEIEVRFTNGSLLLGFKNLDILHKTIWQHGNNIWAGSAHFVLAPIVLNNDYTGSTPSVTWYSSNTDIIEVDNGRLYGILGGMADVTIKSAGFVDGIITINVKSPMESVSLALDKSDDIKGIEGKRVFGIKSYHYDELDNGYVDNTLKLEVASFRPANAEQAYDYRSSNTDYATIDDKGIITFYEAGIGKKVIIYITARYSVSARPVRDYYEFELVDAVNVGLNINSNENTDDTPNYRTFREMRLLLDNRDNPESVAMHTNAYVPPEAQGGGGFTAYGNIFGNGFKYDAQFYEKNANTSLLHINYDFTKFQQVEFRNLTINSAYATDDFMIYKKNGGTVFVIGSSDEAAAGKMFTLKYCIVQYSFSNIYLYGGNLTLDGCVFRNTAGPTMNINVEPNHAPEIIIRNTIFSNIIAPIMMLYSMYAFYNQQHTMDKYTTIRLEGKNYIYNWKEIQSIRVDVVPEGSLPGNLTESFNDMINKTVRQELKGEKYDKLKVDAKDPITGLNKTYVNFSILILGVWDDGSNYNLIYNENDYVRAELDTANIPLLKSMGFTHPCYLLLPQNPNGIPSTMPGETYELNEKTLKRLRGEG